MAAVATDAVAPDKATAAAAGPLRPEPLPADAVALPEKAEPLPAAALAAARAAPAQGLTPAGALAALLGCDERQALQRLAASFGIAFREAPDLAACEPAFELLPLSRAQQKRAMLLRLPGAPGETPARARLLAVVSDPFDSDLWVQLESLARSPLSFALASDADIHALLNRHESGARAVDELLDHLGPHEAPAAAEVLSLASLDGAASPAVRLVNSTIYDALRAGASDVHLESTAEGMAVKYRIDGVLDTVTSVPGITLAEHAISRLKVLADLDIAEQRVPQDGSFRVIAQKREIDLRVSIMPSVHGEDAVIRILDKQAMVAAHGRLTLDALGFDANALATLRELMQAAYGMLLVTGPTGSGKTTTLYAALSESHTGREKIITIEDPVEYQLPGVLQIPVNEKKGLSFARGLRSILRHDPDRIMVGEIRDRDTAEIAVQSALTGHLVLSTVHANNVFDVFGRFTHMGLDPYALVSALNGIWAQRLVRLGCPSCARDHVPAAAELARMGLSSADVSGWTLRRSMGCAACRGTGYRGRRAVAEILRLDDELREMIVTHQPVRLLKEAARRRGTRTLAEAALDLVRQGLTTLEEVRRVTLSA
jgi:general secretion pathway protein E